MKNFIFTVVFILLCSSFALSASFVVNDSSDTSDANLTDNICADAIGNCTLRAAVEQANALSSDDVITFVAGLPTITLTSATDIAIANTGTLQINGPGANVLTISGGASYNRIFKTTNATVTIADLTLTDGGTTDFSCGCSGPLNGGAILVNDGSVTIQRVYFAGNIAGTGGGPSLVSGSGGGIFFSGGSHLIQNSTFANNSSSSVGGAIGNSNGNLTVTNCTISNNTGAGAGGGINNTGTLMLRNTTVANNFAYKIGGIFGASLGGGIYHNTGTLEINNTIVAGNTVQNTTPSPSIPEIYFNSGAIISTGNNFIGDSAGDSTNTGTPIAYQPTDIRDISPMLAAALANNGGTTPTRALLAGSPAINAGNNNAPPTDQRGAPRNGVVDIGAYEFGGLLFSISGRVTSDGTNGLSGVTVTLSGSSSAATTTNFNGEYSFNGLSEGGSYTVTPTLSGVMFDPPNAVFNNLSGNQTANFRPQCIYSISPTSATFPASGGNGSINVTASAGCGWTATSNANFISITNGAGTGSGTMTFSVAANNGAPRSGTITVAGQTFTVNQLALPTLSINNVSQFEGNSGTTPFTFTVTLSSVSGATVIVNYATVNGTATPTTDYQGIAGTLSFAPGETSKTITILVNGDTTVEPNETFTVNLSGAANATITVAQGTGTIRNDDGTSARTPYDFDGDGRADLAVFRPSNGYWYLLLSQTNSFKAVQFGQSGDLVAPGDYDGDGKADIAVWRGVVPGAGNFAYFYVLNSSDNSFRYAQFGATGDVPVTGDWDGDGKADLAVYREDRTVTFGGQSKFYYRPSSIPGADFTTISWGSNDDKPLVGDFDGDGKLDAAIFQPSTAKWYILRSSNNQVIQTTFGLSTDIPTPADFDGDGITNIAVFRPSNGTWFTSTNPAVNYGAIQFGASGDMPIAADYDGDGKADVAVFRSTNGAWYLNRSTQGFTGVAFGAAEDKPIPNAFVR